ncbi:MAG: hypothetical protein ACJAYC_003839, partial [Halieaceae bacterium]
MINTQNNKRSGLHWRLDEAYININTAAIKPYNSDENKRAKIRQCKHPAVTR